MCVPVGGVVCQERSPAEDKVLMGCEDGSVVLYDEYRKLTQMTSAAFVRTNSLLEPAWDGLLW